MSRRKVTQDEEKLLEIAMRGVKPSRKRAAKPKTVPKEPTARPAAAVSPSSQAIRGKGEGVSKRTTPPKPPLQPIDRRTEQNLKRGKIEISATLDLHGMKQAEAHRVLVSFIVRCAADSHKAVLVITGKGSARGKDDSIMPSERRGVLKTQVPLWLEEPGLREHVIGLRAAGPRHGGSGALYVLLRRQKSGR